MNAVIGLIIAGMAVEGAALSMLHRRTGRGVPPRALWPILASGVLLLLAVLLARNGAAWYWLCACLLAAGIGHVADLRTRWRASLSGG